MGFVNCVVVCVCVYSVQITIWNDMNCAHIVHVSGVYSIQFINYSSIWYSNWSVQHKNVSLNSINNLSSSSSNSSYNTTLHLLWFEFNRGERSLSKINTYKFWNLWRVRKKNMTEIGGTWTTKSWTKKIHTTRWIKSILTFWQPYCWCDSNPKLIYICLNV